MASTRRHPPASAFRRTRNLLQRAHNGGGLWLTAFLIAFGSPAATTPAKAPLTIAAAADLARALPLMGEAFQRRTGIRITIVLGSTGLLERQIENGAPFDIFMAADSEHVMQAARAGCVAPGSQRTYALGVLALWTRPGAPVVRSLGDLARPFIARIAIANPLHAPYGKAAIQALTAAGIRGTAARKLVYGENVQQALRYAQSGAADVALVAYPLVVGGPGNTVLVPPHMYTPPRQTLCILKASAHPREAMRFIAFVCGAEGRAILKRFGYLLPVSSSKG